MKSKKLSRSLQSSITQTRTRMTLIKLKRSSKRLLTPTRLFPTLISVESTTSRERRVCDSMSNAKAKVEAMII